MGLLIHGSCVLSYAKVKRTPHLGFTLAYIALTSAVYWLLCNKWAVYCKCGLAARLCVMYSLTCIVLAVSLLYYTFTVSKVIIMRIPLHGGASNKIKNGIGSNRPNVFLFSDNEFGILSQCCTQLLLFRSAVFLFRALFSFIIISCDPYQTGITAHIRPVLSPCQAGVQII